jgi:hypothetical protein
MESQPNQVRGVLSDCGEISDVRVGGKPGAVLAFVDFATKTGFRKAT